MAAKEKPKKVKQTIKPTVNKKGELSEKDLEKVSGGMLRHGGLH